MIKMIQILKWMKKKNLSFDKIMEELTEIVDNGKSQYFELSDVDINRISDIFQDDSKFESALHAADIKPTKKSNLEKVARIAKKVKDYFDKKEQDKIQKQLKPKETVYEFKDNNGDDFYKQVQKVYKGMKAAAEQKNKWHKGKIVWFNKYEMRGFIVSPEFKSEKDPFGKVYISTEMHVEKHPELLDIKKGTPVEFTLFPGTEFLQANKLKMDGKEYKLEGGLEK